jgi:peptidoglycan/xylan/chitin deacetylase (PgdA/CDA1 family)
MTVPEASSHGSAPLSRGIGRALSPSGRRARLAVFSYHQVFERKDPLRPGEPDAKEFANDVATIARVFSVLPLREAARRLATGSLPARAACITFDDGYANNFEIAAPILEAAGVSATIFVAGDAVDTGVMWNDLIIEAVRRRGDAPLLVRALDSSAERDRLRGPSLVAHVVSALKYTPLERRSEVARAIYRDNAGDERLPRLMMTRAMVADLAARGIEIGGHTLRHPILTAMSDEQAWEEIRGCSRWIEEITRQVPRCFAYPNGRPGTDFGPQHAAMVAKAGFELAVSTEWSVAHARTDPYSIPRVGPWWRQNRSLSAGMLRLYLRSYLRG